MRDWYALLIGATFRPQTRGSYFDVEFPRGSCGVGAIKEGREGRQEDPNLHFRDMAGVDESIPYWGTCPLKGKPMWIGSAAVPRKFTCLSGPGHSNVIHLNDGHRLTRPAIAYLLYRREREVKGADEKDDALFKEIFGPLEEMDGVAQAIDPKLMGVTR